MFTQCTNCKAIFRVSMREVTVSQGFLRCGECLEVFDSSANLSTTMQEPFIEVDIKKSIPPEDISLENIRTISALDDWQSVPSTPSKPTPSADTTQLRENSLEESPAIDSTKTKKEYKPNITSIRTKSSQQEHSEPNTKKKISLDNLWPKVTIGLLSLLLIFQLTYRFTDLFSTNTYDHAKIHMLNHNVFAHPIDKNALLISASIENTADFDQPFPFLEVRLTNSKEQLVALRRFSPDEYLSEYSENMLLTKNLATNIKLKIKDPGNQATRFQFDFL